MGRLLAELIADFQSVTIATPATLRLSRKESGTEPVATPATPATFAPEPAARVAKSQESQGAALASATDQAERLLAELRGQYLPDEWIGLDHGDVAALATLTDRQLSAYVRMLADADLRRRGKVPRDETAMALCHGCGPVWVAPEVAAAAPMVDGWPRVLGCPWCHVRHAGLYVPRPPVECGSCRHFERDTVNPPSGMGRCTAGHELALGEPLHWPFSKRQCKEFEPSP